MDLTRPKSSKGRRRPTVESLCPRATGGIQRTGRYLRSQSQPTMCQDPAVKVLYQGPVAPQPLNKYNVLPSIQRRQPEVRGVDEHVPKLHLCGGQQQVCLHSEEVHFPPQPAGVPPHPDTEPKEGSSSAGATGGLLVAVRTPCGERFEQLFDPTDDLRMVRISAEARYGTQYGEVSIKSMDVPSRTFTDMDQTLAQCGIVNRSVLCIMENDSYKTHTTSVSHISI